MVQEGANSPPPDEGGPARSRTDAEVAPAEPLTPLRELQLVEAHRRGDPGALTDLLKSYQKRVYGICYRMVGHREDAADLTQDALIRVLEGLPSYDGRSKLSTWVFRVTMNCCLSHLRKAKVRQAGSLDEPVDATGLARHQKLPDQREPAAEQRIEQEEQRAALFRALAALDPDARAMLVLRDLQDLDYQQLADVLSVPVGTVKSRLFRARAALRGAAEVELDRSSAGSGGATGVAERR